MSKLKCGLIQMGLKGDGTMPPEKIRDLMIEAHIPMIDDAAKQGVKVLCFQEVFTQPYFCPSQDKKWYAAAESIPDGPTVKLMQEYAKKYQMVIVVPIYEEEVPGIYYNTAAVTVSYTHIRAHETRHALVCRLLLEKKKKKKKKFFSQRHSIVRAKGLSGFSAHDDPR